MELQTPFKYSATLWGCKDDEKLSQLLRSSSVIGIAWMQIRSCCTWMFKANLSPLSYN